MNPFIIFYIKILEDRTINRINIILKQYAISSIGINSGCINHTNSLELFGSAIA